MCLDPFPPPRVSLVRPGRVHSPVLGPWRVTDHSKPTPNQKGVEACSPRPATPHYDLLKTGYRGLQGHQMPLSCPFTQTPLMERREDSPSSRNSHRLPGREDLDVPECAHHVSASTHAHACPPVCVHPWAHLPLWQCQAGPGTLLPSGEMGATISRPPRLGCQPAGGALLSPEGLGPLETQRRDPCRELWAGGGLHLTVAS